MELKPFGEKAWTFIMTPIEMDFRFTILEGSIRSSKTWAMMIKLLALSRYEVAGFRVITGVSKNSIYQNVLKDLFELVGKNRYRYNRNTGVLQIFGCEWLVVGAKDEGSAKFIQGMTIGIVYCDELTNMPQSFYLMLTSRMSPAGARFYATCNPADPYHYVKTEIIDNKDLKNAGQVKVYHFTLDDNPNLSREARATYERMYKGMFYLRYIKGLWVIAEGAIYRDVWDEGDPRYWAGEIDVAGMSRDEISKLQGIYYDDRTRPAGLFQRGVYESHVIAVDYGTHNPCVFLDIWDDGTTAWVEKEYYFDSTEARFQKTDAQYANDLAEFMGENQGAKIIIDPSAASFKTECINRGWWVADADNEVLDGIRRTSSMLAQRKIRVNRKNCPKGPVEMQTYAWDPKNDAQGHEKPIKLKDHWPDALRYYTETEVPEYRLAA